MTAKQLLKTIDNAGISHSSICKALKVNKATLSRTLNGKLKTLSAIELLSEVREHLIKVKSLIRIDETDSN